MDRKTFMRGWMLLALFNGALVIALVNLPWGVVAFVGTYFALFVAIWALVGVLSLLEWALTHFGYYRWRSRRRLAKKRAKREAARG